MDLSLFQIVVTSVSNDNVLSTRFDEQENLCNTFCQIYSQCTKNFAKAEYLLNVDQYITSWFTSCTTHGKVYFQDSSNFRTQTVGLSDCFFFSYTSMFSADGFTFLFSCFIRAKIAFYALLIMSHVHVLTAIQRVY